MMPRKWIMFARDAETAGMQVRHGRSYINVRNGSVGLDLWEDGTATRSDVQYDMCATLRTVSQAAAAIGLKVDRNQAPTACFGPTKALQIKKRSN